MLKKNLCTLVGAASVVSGVVFAGSAEAAGLINGDFEIGDLTGWTTFTTPNGTVGNGFPTVDLFDTNNDSTATNSAVFRVGAVVFGSPGGGGIFQDVSLHDGDLTLSVDVATLGGSAFNNSGGLFELLFDGAVVDTFNSGPIDAGTPEFSVLSFMDDVVAGTYQIGVRITRPFTQNSTSPTQYVDNFQISGSAVDKDVPEPTATLALLGIGTLAIKTLNRRKQ